MTRAWSGALKPPFQKISYWPVSALRADREPEMEFRRRDMSHEAGVVDLAAMFDPRDHASLDVPGVGRAGQAEPVSGGGSSSGC